MKTAYSSQVLKQSTVSAMVGIFATSLVGAAPILVTRQQSTIEQSTTVSAFFTQSPDNLIAFTPAVGFSGTIGAGDGANTVSSATFNIIGNSTSGGNWIDGNGVPLGITLSFTAQFTLATPTLDSYLTLGGNSGTAMGNGIGITQTAGTIGSIGPDEVLEISGLTLGSINFSGVLSEAGFTFTPGTVNNAQWNRLRSNNFPEATAGATISVGADTWGFGTSTGTMGSNLAIDNNYNVILGFATAGPLVITTEAGAWNLKGLGFQYDLSYDITPVPEPTTAVIGLMGGFLLYGLRRRI
jgi:hypothetical protein